MKSPFVRELKPDEIATAVFLVHTKEIRQKRTGEPYLSLVLSDRTGEIDCKMWDNVAEVMETFDRDDFVKVKGLLQLYNNRPQFTIHKSAPRGGPRSRFRAISSRPRCRIRKRCGASCGAGRLGSATAHLRACWMRFWTTRISPPAIESRRPQRRSIMRSAAACWSMCSRSASWRSWWRPHYRAMSTSTCCCTGVVLHDIGKIYELSYERGFGYSAEGQLIGHIAIAMRMMADKLRAFPDFPVELRNLVEHMILSHHGQLEFGSPKVPIFPEALLLHYLDDMDSKMECMRAADR